MKKAISKLKMPSKMNEKEDDKMLEIELESPEQEAAEGKEEEAGEEELFKGRLEDMEGEGEEEEGEEEAEGGAGSMSDEELMGEIAKRGLLKKLEMEHPDEPMAMRKKHAAEMTSKYMPGKK